MSVGQLGMIDLAFFVNCIWPLWNGLGCKNRFQNQHASMKYIMNNAVLLGMAMLSGKRMMHQLGIVISAFEIARTLMNNYD